MEKGQSLLTSDRPEEALACFDEVLAVEPKNAEALVKKGTAFEKMRQPQEALEYYDRAIAADNSLDHCLPSQRRPLQPIGKVWRGDGML